MSNRPTGGGGLLAGPGIMLISAALFGYFGFFYGINWSTPGVDGQPVLFRVMLGWTLQVSAIGFAAAAVLTYVHGLLGNAVYALIGLVGAILFLVIAAMDWLDAQHGVFGGAPVILVLFALWNGYGSWMSLKAVLAIRAASDAHRPEPRDEHVR